MHILRQFVNHLTNFRARCYNWNMKFFDFLRRKQPIINDGKEIATPIKNDAFSVEQQNFFDAAVDDDFEDDPLGEDPLCDDPDFPQSNDFDDFESL